MAHFAKIDENTNKVLDVVVVNNTVLMNGLMQEEEQKGIDFLTNLFGGKWVQTSYNSNFRFNYASIGGLYDEINDAFIPPKLFNSWILNTTTFKWEAPVPYPSNGIIHAWSEKALNWIGKPEDDEEYMWNNIDEIWIKKPGENFFWNSDLQQWQEI